MSPPCPGADWNVFLNRAPGATAPAAKVDGQQNFIPSFFRGKPVRVRR